MTWALPSIKRGYARAAAPRIVIRRREDPQPFGAASLESRSMLSRAALSCSWPSAAWLRSIETSTSLFRVDGTGTVHVSGRPALWAAFKGLPLTGDEEGMKQACRQLFEKSGLRVRRVTVTRRRGLPNLFASVDFEDINRLAGTPAFPDLKLSLTQQGVRLHLDDFGTGYSSLSYLHRFPISAVKIDRYFIARIEAPECAAIIRSVVELSKQLGMDTIAEGAESDVQGDRLRALGCRLLQGYACARPVPPQEAELLLARQRGIADHAIPITPPHLFTPRSDVYPSLGA